MNFDTVYKDKTSIDFAYDQNNVFLKSYSTNCPSFFSMICLTNVNAAELKNFGYSLIALSSEIESKQKKSIF